MNCSNTPPAEFCTVYAVFGDRSDNTDSMTIELSGVAAVYRLVAFDAGKTTSYEKKNQRHIFDHILNMVSLCT